ncbi:GNAT family N-acetyltransferase [Paenibacillus amylolyticus]|nr:GNAT family N-acetyltransferase [Paenibacillus amylolyticus]
MGTFSDPQVIRYVNRGSQPTPTRARRLLNQIRSSSAKLDSLHYGICWRGKEQVIGITSFQHWNDQNGTAQIGYILNRSCWGMGVATEAVQRLLQFGFDDLHLWRVEARCYEANVSSQRVLSKNRDVL